MIYSENHRDSFNLLPCNLICDEKIEEKLFIANYWKGFLNLEQINTLDNL